MDTLFRLFCQHLRTISFHARNLFSSIRYSDSKPQLQNKDHTHRPTLDTDTGLIIRRMSISLPMVSKGMDRVRVYLHAGNIRIEMDTMVNASVAWAASIEQ